MTDCYTEYADFIGEVVATGDISQFKQNPRYTYMLEHVSERQGHEYLYYIESRFGCIRSDIIAYAEMNDSIGNPLKYNYLGKQISPSSLRYFLHAMLILSYFKEKTTLPIAIVELGGGYGGLCLAINYCLKFFPDLKISEYTIIDLAQPIQLQSLYLARFSLSFPTKYLDGKNFGVEVQDSAFFISNYCFSEIAIDLQLKYQEVLLPKMKHGFITWNTGLRDIGKSITIEEEYPKTAASNFYIRF